MEKKYRSSNIRFNMSDPIQKKAWEYLQSQKGCASYGRLISEAIIRITEKNNDDAGMKSVKEIDLSEKSIREIITQIIAEMKKNDISFYPSGESDSVVNDEENISPGVSVDKMSEDISSEMSGFLFG